MKNSQARALPLRSLTHPYDAAAERAGNVVGERIAAARKKTGMSQQLFSEYLERYGISISKAAESKWETGETVPNAYQLLAVCAALGIEEPDRYFHLQYSPLLNAEGERKVSDYRSDLIASGKYRPAEPIRYRDMPVSRLCVSAGTGAFLDEDQFDTVSFPERSIPAGAAFGVRVSGDSMEPVYHDGQIVWVQECSSLLPGEVGVFLYDGEGYIKSYAEQEPPEDRREDYTDSYGIVRKQPVLISFNRAYPPRAVSPDAGFCIVGKVL